MLKIILKIISIITILGTLVSCSTSYRSLGDTHREDNLKKVVEKRSTNEDCIITTLDNYSFTGKSIKFDGDNLIYIDDNFVSGKLPLTKVNTIAIRSTAKGIGTGAAVGASIGALIGFVGGNDSVERTGRTFIFSPLGAIMGVVVGGAVGSYDLYMFNEIENGEVKIEEFDYYPEPTEYLD